MAVVLRTYCRKDNRMRSKIGLCLVKAGTHFALEQAMRTQSGNRGITILFI